MERSTDTWSSASSGAYGRSDSDTLVSTGREQAKGVLGAARERLLSQLDSRKGQLADRLDGWSGMLERAGSAANEDGSAPKLPVESVERAIRSASAQLRDRSTQELLETAEDAIRARPGVALAGLAAIGFLAVRWVRG